LETWYKILQGSGWKVRGYIDSRGSGGLRLAILSSCDTMKVLKFLKNLSLYFLIILVVVLSFFVLDEQNKLYAEPISATAIVIVAATLIIAGYTFYNYDEMVAAAKYYYDDFPDDIKQEIQTAALIGGTTYEISKDWVQCAIDNYRNNVVGSYETVVDVFDNLYEMTITDYAVVEYMGDLFFVNTNEGGYYQSSYYFPEYDEVKHKIVGLKTAEAGTVKLEWTEYESQWAWSFYYTNGLKYYYSSNLYIDMKNFFSDQTSRVVDSVEYNLNKGSFLNYYEWPDTEDMKIVMMAVADTVLPYIARKSIGGGTSYDDLWKPAPIEMVGEGAYEIPQDLKDKLASGTGALNIDVQYGKSGALADSSLSGSDVLSGADSVSLDLPIDNASTLLGTNSSGILAGVYGNITEGSIAEGAASDTIAEWESGYEGDMSEMSIPAIIINKFPFCIPFDFAYAVAGLMAPAEVPIFQVTIPFPGGENVNWELDFTMFETLAKIIRWGVLIIFNFGLILITRKIIKG